MAVIDHKNGLVVIAQKNSDAAETDAIAAADPVDMPVVSVVHVELCFAHM